MSLYINFYIRKQTLIVKLNGEMDQYTADDLKLKLIEFSQKYEIKNVIFNFSKLSFMDSSGIGIILGRYNQVKCKDGKIVLCEMNKEIKRIVLLSGLPKICALKETEENAKCYLGIM